MAERACQNGTLFHFAFPQQGATSGPVSELPVDRKNKRKLLFFESTDALDHLWRR